MSAFRFALWVVMGVVGPLPVVVLGAVVTVAVTHCGETGPEPDGSPRPAHAGRAMVSDDGESVHVFLDVAAADVSTNLVVHGADRAELAAFQIYRGREFSFEPAGSDLPVRYIGAKEASGTVDLGVQSGHARIILIAQPDGSAKLSVKDDSYRSLYDMPITAKGETLPYRYKPAL